VSKIKYFLAVLALLLLSGCFKTSADELYYLPRASEEYFKLQTRIDETLASGAEYSPPTGGENRQSVQLADIDGDGVKEAVAFFVFQSEDNPLRIHIFRSDGDDYVLADVIEGVGAGIESIRYIDMDGDGVLELLVGWQMGVALKHMSLYSERGFQHIKIADAEYTSLAIAQLAESNRPNIIVARPRAADAPSAVEAFALMDDGEVVSAETYLSDGIESIVRITPGRLSDGGYALFIEGRLTEGGLITDVVCLSGSALLNITHSPAEAPVARAVSVYSSDINRDGVTETPILVPLLQQSETTYYAIDWYAYTSGGERDLVLSTYHNYSDWWYLVLSDEWRGKLTVRREDTVNGERTLVFSFADGDEFYTEIHDFLKIYTLSGDNREERARLPGRFRLLEEGDKIFAAELYDPGPGQPAAPGETEIRDSFKRLYSDWLAGG
jgi:hypothetical protein